MFSHIIFFALNGVNITWIPLNQYQVIKNKLEVITIAKCTLNSTELEVLAIVDHLSKLVNPFLMFPDSRQACRESIFSLRRCAVWKVKLFSKWIGFFIDDTDESNSTKLNNCKAWVRFVKYKYDKQLVFKF